MTDSLRAQVEALLFASPEPLEAEDMLVLLGETVTVQEIKDVIHDLTVFFHQERGGFYLAHVPKIGYQFQTVPAVQPLMEKQFSSRPRPLSRAALETLAVISYRQRKSKGVTRAEVEFIRGVDAGSIFRNLMERGLITCVGRREVPGRPMMFAVTPEFFRVFHIHGLEDLPPLESFQVNRDVLQEAEKKIQDFESDNLTLDTDFIDGKKENKDTESSL